MDVKSDDEDIETKLDVEFRRILRIIKIYVPCIMNVDYLTSYRLWLEKLSEADIADKQDRNRYSIELCRQIQDGILEWPFDQRPLPGPLPPLKRNLGTNKEVLQQQLQHIQQQQHLLQLQQQQQQISQQHQHEQLQKQYQYYEDVIPVKQESVQNTIAKELNRSNRPSTSKQEVQNYPVDSEYQNYLKGLPKTVHVQKEVQVANNNTVRPKLIVLKNPPSSKPLNISHKKRNQHTVLKEIQEHIRNSNKYRGQNNVLVDLASTFPKPPGTQTDVISSYMNAKESEDTQQRYVVPNDCCLQDKPNTAAHHEEVQPQNSVYVKENPIPQQHTSLRTKEDDESSWLDLSATASRMESGDSANSLLPRQSPHPAQSNNSTTHDICESKIKELIEIVAELKRQNLFLNARAEAIIQSISDEVKLLKLKEQKLNEIKASHQKSVASVQWKNTVSDLKQTLKNAQEEIVTLQSEIVGLKEKLEEFSSQKQQDNVTIRQRLADMYDKEIEMLKQNYVRHIVDIENKFTQILVEKEAAFNKKLNDLKELYDKKIAEITKGISEMSPQRPVNAPEKCVGRPTTAKKTFISKNVPEKDPADKGEKLFDEKRPWRKRLMIGSYKINNV